MDFVGSFQLGHTDLDTVLFFGFKTQPNQIGLNGQFPVSTVRKDNQADVLSPVGGVIVEVNSKVRENPEIANREPYSDGWLFMVRNPNIKKSVEKLMADTTTVDWISDEVTRLESMIEEVAGPLAADGGYLQDDIYGNLPDLGWNRLTNTFLKT